ncbi:MAG TPA: response regulator transcription factor [Chromatiaceae bacterium]|jgi:DNA-binding NarL/FixJ family response regulator|nr:response regulator transcription factor [Chromatiaceae bacterium]HIA08661.1 response regulator transcription factor [Chromatiaceae bacterium]HIB83394.1 response regulator transcription factor [Chromatiaceae bacterium]HIN81973.1 response regulator transcription factor [Chromatiales bacterium]HIO54947.1 response regulator transcription factor [Chromatiales bacterium]
MTPSNIRLVPEGATAATTNQVFIVARHDFSVDGILSILETEEDTYTISCMEPTDTCRQKFLDARPDILLLHKSIPTHPVEDYLDAVLALNPDVRILIFGQGMTDDFLHRCVKGGVYGYINERMTGEHLKKAMTAIRLGDLWVERKIMQRFVNEQANSSVVVGQALEQKASEFASQLTRREAQILEKLLQGFATKEIAEEVCLSHQGVKLHLSKLFRKFEVTNRSQLILAALNAVSPVPEMAGHLREALTRAAEV